MNMIISESRAACQVKHKSNEYLTTFCSDVLSKALWLVSCWLGGKPACGTLSSSPESSLDKIHQIGTRWINIERMKKVLEMMTYPLLLLFLTVRPKKELAAVRSVQTEHKVPLRIVVGGLNACLVRKKSCSCIQRLPDFRLYNRVCSSSPDRSWLDCLQPLPQRSPPGPWNNLVSNWIWLRSWFHRLTWGNTATVHRGLYRSSSMNEWLLVSPRIEAPEDQSNMIS